MSDGTAPNVTPRATTTDERRAIVLYAVGARDISDFLDMIVEEETTLPALEFLRDMLAAPGTDKTDVELNKLLLPIVERALEKRRAV